MFWNKKKDSFPVALGLIAIILCIAGAVVLANYIGQGVYYLLAYKG